MESRRNEIIVSCDAEFLEEAEELFHANAFEGGEEEIENVVTSETLDRMVKELATHTHPEDKQRYVHGYMTSTLSSFWLATEGRALAH